MAVDLELRDFGRALMGNPEVKGMKLSVFLKDGRYVEYNNMFDPIFNRDKEERRWKIYQKTQLKYT